MNGEIYRLNIRFDLADKTQRSIVEQLQSIDRKRYGSINKFIIAAIGKAFDSNGSSTLTVEEVRSIIREECCLYISAAVADANSPADIDRGGTGGKRAERPQ